jgi:hypothetical protein
VRYDIYIYIYIYMSLDVKGLINLYLRYSSKIRYRLGLMRVLTSGEHQSEFRILCLV